jgi:hypothetical protein
MSGNFNGDPAFSNLLVRNPDFIEKGTLAQHLLVGVTYAVKKDETLVSVAARFRTTVKSILSLNFDLDTSSDSTPRSPLPGVCVCVCCV